MLKLERILVPFAFTKTPPHLMQQAAWLARRFNAAVILLHVVPPLSYPSGMLESGHEITARDLHAHIIQRAQEDLDKALLPDFDGITVTRVLLRGDPAREIVETARNGNVDLIVVSTMITEKSTASLLGSVTAKDAARTRCPVWISGHFEEAPPVRDFSIRRVLCSVDLTPHNRHTLSQAAGMAAAVNATLTLVHITSSVEVYGPGGTHVDHEWRDKIVGFAAEELARLKQDLRINAEVVIESGNVPQLLNRVAEQTKADVLVVGHIPGRSHLGDNGEGYGIIRESRIPVLSV